MSDEYDVVVIGAGPGGYVAAIRAAQLGLSVACVDKNPALGGTCLNVGCIPSKSLLHSSELFWKLSHEASKEGIDIAGLKMDFNRMMSRKTEIIRGFNQGIAGLFKKNKVVQYIGEARLLSPQKAEVKSGPSVQEISARHFILATGSEPMALPFLPFDEKKVVSSTGALSLEKIPQKLLIVGAGVIGVELGSVYSRLGSEVVFIEFLDRICPTFDESLSKALFDLLKKQGMDFHLSSKVVGAKVSDRITLDVLHADNSQSEMTGDVVLVSIGRKPYVLGLGLENVGIEASAKGIAVDGGFRTKVPNIFAIGDLIDGPMLAHKASEEGVAVAEIIAGHHPTLNYLSVPNVIYTYPEVASVGFTEAEAKKAGLQINTGTFPFKANSRARCIGDDEGFVKMIAEEKSDRIIGVHIIGANASELIAEGCLAIEKKTTALEMANTFHPHPTLSEAMKEAALCLHKRAIHR